MARINGSVAETSWPSTARRSREGGPGKDEVDPQQEPPPPFAMAIGASQRRPGALTRADNRAEWPGASALALLAVGLLAFFAAPYPTLGLGFPVGPDGPVYLWWARIAGAEGLSAAGLRPGVPALHLVLAGATGLTSSQVLAALGPALGAAVGLAAMALAWPVGRAQGWLAGALGGTFAAHLAGGYFANLAFVAVFLAAGAALVRGRGRASAAGAAALLGAGGLAHPLFLPLGAAILVLATLLGWRTGGQARDEARMIGLAVGGAGVVAGAGLAAALLGPGPPAADTSKDAFLRRAGLEAALRGDYLNRLSRLWARFVLPVSVPLAGLGLRAGAFPAARPSLLRRLLLAWAAVTLAGVVASLATGLFPPVRFLSFAYALPLGVAMALPWVHARIRDRSGRPAGVVAAGVVAAVLVAAMLAGAAYTWWRQNPFIHDAEVKRLGTAARVANATPAGTPLVFLVDDDDPELIFLATLAGNIVRASMPPDRVRDVYLYVGTPARYLAGRPTLVGDASHDAMSRLYLEDVRAAGGEPLALVVAPFNRPGMAEARRMGVVVERGVVVLGEGPVVAPADVASLQDPLEPFSRWSVPVAAIALFALLTVVGLGWSRAAMGPGGGALALAPAFGAAALIVAGVAVDRLGLRLEGFAVPAAVSALAATGGYLASLHLQRGAGPEPVA